MAELTDSNLLSEFRERGSEDAFRLMVERHSRVVFGVCRRILENEADAQDAAQAAFIALALKASKLDASNGLGGWLHRVSRQVSLDLRKARQRRSQREEIARQLTSSTTGAHPCDEISAVIDDAVNQLPEKLRATVIQHYFQGEPVGEIAARHGCAASAVSMRLERARALLRKRLTRLGFTASAAGEAALAKAASTAEPSAGFVPTAQRVALAAAAPGGTAPFALAGADLARRALRELLLGKIRWVAAGAAALALSAGLGFAAARNPPASEASRTLSVAKFPTPTPPPRPPATPAAPAPTPPPADPPLITAIRKNYNWENATDFKHALDVAGGEIDTIRDAEGRTALNWASRKNDEEFALMLLLRGASPDAADVLGQTPLFIASGHGDLWMELLFLLRGADLNHQANDFSTPLTRALARNDRQGARRLLWLGASTTLEGAPDEAQPLAVARAQKDPRLARLVEDYAAKREETFQQSPRTVPLWVKDALQDAARRGDFNRLEEVLRTGQTIDTPDDEGRTALHHAISAGQAEMVFYLLMAGANPNAADFKGGTPLMYTMGWLGGGLDAMRRFLIIKGANPRAMRLDGQSEMSWAVTRANEHGVQWLLWLGVNGGDANAKFGTPIKIAYEAGAQRVIDLLRRNGIEEPLPVRDDPVWNLNNAAKRGDLEAVRKLLDAGVVVDSPDADGQTPLVNAIGGRNVPVARFLIERGADVNSRSPKDGGTPLLATVCWDYGEMTAFREELLASGADPNARTSDGTPVIMRAIWHTPTTPLKQLIDHGADLNARDAEGRSLLARTMEEGKIKTAEFLRIKGAIQ